MSDLSVVEKTRIREYQDALARGDDEAADDAAGKLRALGLEPGIARLVRISDDEIGGDR